MKNRSVRARMRFQAQIAICLATGGMLQAANWSAVNSGLPTTVAGLVSLANDPATPSTLYACASTGQVFKSTDGGASWKTAGGVTGANSIAIDPKNSSTVYAATNHGVAKSKDGGATWIIASLGLSENFVFQVALDPMTPSTIYAITSTGIFKSADGAGTWNAINTFPATEFPGPLVIDPSTPSTLYISTAQAHIFRSTDGGASWNMLGAGGSCCFSEHAVPLAIDPVNPSTIYAGSFAAGSGVVPGGYDFGQGTVSKSTDGGQTWTVSRTGIPSDALVISLAVDPESPSTVFAGYVSGSGWGLLKSADGGQSWSVIDTGLPPYDVNPVLAVSPGAPSTVYAGYVDLNRGRGRLVKSVDGGTNWSWADAGLTYIDLRTLAADPMNTSVVYAGLGVGGGIFKTGDGGANWSQLAQFWSDYGVVQSVLIDSTNPKILYAATAISGSCRAYDKLLFKSTDGGGNWTNSVSPPFDGCVLSDFFGGAVLAMAPSDSNTLYAGGDDDCGGTDLDQTVDNGADWKLFYLGGHLYSLVIAANDPATLYGGTSGGLFKSADGGKTWNNLAFKDNLVKTLAMDPGDPAVLYAETESYEYSEQPTGFQGLYKSTDAGATWSPIGNGLAGVAAARSSVTALVVAPDHTKVVYAGTSSGVYRSVDGGSNWTAYNDGLTDLDIRGLAIVSGSPNTLYAATPAGVFKLVDRLADDQQ